MKIRCTVPIAFGFALVAALALPSLASAQEGTEAALSTECQRFSQDFY